MGNDLEMDPNMMYLNLELIDSLGSTKEEAVAVDAPSVPAAATPMSSNPSSFGSLISLESPLSSEHQVGGKRAAELEESCKPEKKQRLGRKPKNSGLRAERNRQSAAASRERSKRHLQELERLSVTLPDANMRLASCISRMSQPNDRCKALKSENEMLQAKIEQQQAKLEKMSRSLENCK